MVFFSILCLVIFSPNFLILNIHNTDDSFYYFNIAKNIASGIGSTFDGITLTNGYQPLWLTILVPVYKLVQFDLYAPLKIIISISSLIFSLSIFVLMKIVDDFKIEKEKKLVITLLFILFPTLIIFHPRITFFTWLDGTEFILTFFLLSILFRIVFNFDGNKNRDYLIFGFLTGLILLSRTDTILIIFSFPIYLIFISKKFKLNVKNILLYGIPVLSMVLPYLVLNYINFNEFVPVSGQTKAYWNDIGNTVFGNIFDSFYRIGISFIHPLEEIIFLKNINDTFLTKSTINLFLLTCKVLISFLFHALIIIWIFNLKKEKKRKILTLIFFTIFFLFHFGYYLKSFGLIETKYWYWSYEYLIVFFLFAHFVNDIWNKKIYFKCYGKNLLKFTLLFSFVLFFYEITILIKSNEHEYYLQRKEFLELHTSTEDIIGTPSAGAIGYFSDRTIVNIDGLVNSYEYLKAQKNGKDLEYLKEIGVNKFFFSSDALNYEPYRSSYEGKLELIEIWTNSEGEQMHLLYQLNELKNH